VLLADGEPVSPTEPLVGRDMERVVLVKHGRGSPVEGIRVIVACDVSNPLFGPSGAAPVFGPQKGATSHMVRWLDQQLHGLAERTGTLAVAQTHGAGAAGGLGFGLLAWLPGTSLRPGVDLVFDALQVPRRIVQAKLVITGEGRLDASSLHGKAPVAVARACAEVGVPCIAVVGSFDQAIAADVRPLFQRVFALRTGDMTLEQATREAPHRLAEFGRLIAKSLLPT
jgi:glycerate kinase